MRMFRHAQNRKTIQRTNVYKVSRKELIVYVESNNFNHLYLFEEDSTFASWTANLVD